MKRVLVTALLVIGFLGAALPVGAHTDRFTIAPNGKIENGFVTVKGTTQCTLGHKFRIQAVVEQNGSSNQGVATGSCTGSSQPWQVTTKPDSPQPGPAEVTAQQRTTLNSVKHGEDANASRTVELSG